MRYLKILGGVALTLAWADIDCNNLIFSIDKMSSLLGVFMSILGLFVTAYFVVLAIDAYAHIKEIEKSKIEVTNLIEEWKTIIKKAQKTIDSNIELTNKETQKVTQLLTYSNSLYEDLGQQIASEGSNDIKGKLNRRNSLKLKQARMSYLLPMLEIDLREKLLLQLGDIGEKQDVIPISNIIKNENEPERLKKVAKIVLEELKKKLGLET